MLLGVVRLSGIEIVNGIVGSGLNLLVSCVKVVVGLGRVLCIGC